jgi:predicted MFS family arabinose efflux permease
MNEEPSGNGTLTVPPWRLPDWLLLLVLAAIHFTHIMDFVIVIPLGPRFQDEMHLDTQQFGFVVSAYAFSAAISGLLAAGFIDRFDRKHALLTLYGGFTVGTLLCAAAPNYWFLLLARVVAGAFGGIVGSLMFTIVGDAFHESRRGTATGIVMSGFAIASIVGLPIGLQLAEWFGWWAPFAAVGGMGVMVLIAGAVIIPSLRRHLGKGAGRAATLWEVLTEPAHVRAYLLASVLVMSSFMVMPYMPTYVVKNVGRDATELKWIYLCGGIATLATMPLFGRMADRFGKLAMFQVLAMATAVPLLVLTELPRVPLAVVLAASTLMMVTASGRMVPGMALITSCSLPRYRGSFLSVNSSLQQMALGVAALIGGELTATAPDGSVIGYPRVGYLAAIAALATVALAARLRPVEGPSSVPLLPDDLELSTDLLLSQAGQDTPPLDTAVYVPSK